MAVDVMMAVLLGVLIYAFACVVIAMVRALFSPSEKRKRNFRSTFLSFFLEILNPFHWLS